MSASPWVHLDVLLVKKETEKAFLLVLDNDDQDEVWVPKSQMSDPDDYSQYDKNCTISVTEYIAREKGLTE